MTWLNLDEAQFAQRFPNKNAKAIFSRGIYFDPAIQVVLPLNNQRQTRSGYVQTTRFGDPLLAACYVHVNAARSQDRPLGLVWRNEMGKKAHSWPSSSWRLPQRWHRPSC